MLYVVEPGDYQHWMGVRQMQLEEETTKAKAIFRLFRRKLNLAGFEEVACEEVIRQGKTADEVLKLIADDEDIAILVLGAASDAKGPGPLVSSFAAGKAAGGFPIPVTVVPGKLLLEDDLIANIGWAVTAVSLLIWTGMIVSVRLLSQRIPYDLVESDD